MGRRKRQKAAVGEPSLRLSNGTYQLCVSLPSPYGLKRHVFGLGLRDTPEGRAEAERWLGEVRAEITALRLQGTLHTLDPQALKDKIRISRTGTSVRTTDTTLYYVGEVWDLWEPIKREKLSETSIEIKLKPITNWVKRLAVQDMRDEKAFLRCVLDREGRSQNYQAMLVRELKACLAWAFAAKLIVHNPLANVTPESTRKTSGGDPFSRDEVQAIIEAFESRGVRSVALLVRFLANVGCRHSEAFALKWHHITDTHIIFQEGRVGTSHNAIEKKGLKTQNQRRFPLNDGLRSLLAEIRAELGDSTGYVFTHNGKPFNSGSFAYYWYGHKDKKKDKLGTVRQLAADGRISKYREPYALRDTFISHCREAGISYKQIAEWVGNSEKTIIEHYSGVVSEVETPSLF